MENKPSTKTKSLKTSGRFAETVRKQLFKFYKERFLKLQEGCPFILPPERLDDELNGNFDAMMEEMFLCLSVYDHYKEFPDDWPPGKVKVQLENLLVSLEGLGEDAFGMLPPDAEHSIDSLKKSVSWGLELIAMRKPPQRGGHNRIAEPDVELIAWLADIYERFFMVEPTPNQSRFVKFLEYICNGCSIDENFSYTKRSRAAGIEKYLSNKRKS